MSAAWPTKSATDSHVPRFNTKLIGLDDFNAEETQIDEPSGAQDNRLNIVRSDASFSGSVIRFTSFQVSIFQKINTLSEPHVARYFIIGSNETPLTNDSCPVNTRIGDNIEDTILLRLFR